MKTKSVNALDIAPGDILHCYGGRFRVVSAKRYPDARATGGVVQANICEFLGDIPGQTCAMPKHWRTDWNAQGSAGRSFDVEA